MTNSKDKTKLTSAPQHTEAQNDQSPISGACVFEIHVKGHLDRKWSDWLEGLKIKLLDNGEMILFGPIVDQAALMGVLNKLNRLNLTILSVNKMKMEATLLRISRTREHIPWVTLFRGIGWGLMGGLAGTLAMDLILMGGLSAAGLSALGDFLIVGNTVARFFLILGIRITGGVPLGLATLHLVGPLFGGIFGAALVEAGALHVDTLKKCVVLAVLYIEILSQPLVATTPVLLKLTARATLLWFGASFVMHLLYGVVLGVIVSYGLHLVPIRKLGLENRDGTC